MVAVTAVVTVGVSSHEVAGTALGALDTVALDLVTVDVVVGEDAELDLLVLVLELLGLVIHLLLLLLTTVKVHDEVEGGLSLDLKSSKSGLIIEVLALEENTHGVGGDTLGELDLGLESLDRGRGGDVQGKGLTSKSLDEHLHCAEPVKQTSESGENM